MVKKILIEATGFTLALVAQVILPLGLAFGIGALFAMFFQWLWNALLPELFNMPVVSFWQAWGILILTAIVFRGIAGNKQS